MLLPCVLCTTDWALQVCTTTATVTTVPIPCGLPRWIQSGMEPIGLRKEVTNEKNNNHTVYDLYIYVACCR